MQTTPQNLQFFFSDMESRFWNSFTVAPTFYEKIAMQIASNSSQQVYGWTGMTDKGRVWTGSRTVHTPGLMTYTVPNVPFELTEAIDKFALRDDQFGLYYPVAVHMGEQAKKLPDYQLRDLIMNTGAWTGTPQLGTDGLSHWNIAHPVDFYDASKGTYCNDFGTGGVSVGGITVGGALAPNAYATLWQEFASRKSESGEALGILPDLTWVPPQLNITAMTILNAQFFAPAALGGLTGQVGALENMLKGSTSLLMSPELSGYPTTWFMLSTSKADSKPFIWQTKDPVEFVYRIQPQDPEVFNTHTYIYGWEQRGAPAWGMPFMSARSGV